MHEPDRGDGLENLAGARGESQRPVAGGDAFAGDQDVGAEAPVLGGEPSPGSPEAGHHLVGHQQHAPAPADLLDGGPVVIGGDGRAQRGPGDRLGDEAGHVLRAEVLDHPVELLGMPRAAPVRVTGVWAPVLVGRRDVGEPPQPWLVRAAERPATRSVQRPQRVAVIGAPSGDDDVARWLAPGEMECPGKLERGLDGLAPTGDRVDPRALHGQQRRQLRCIGLQRLAGELGAVGVGDPGGLVAHGPNDVRVPVADPHHDRSTRRVQVASAFCVPQQRAFSPHHAGEVAPEDARKDVAHRASA